MLLISVKKKKVFTGKKVMRRLSPIGREDSCDLSLSGKVGGGVGTEEETETHLQASIIPESRIFSIWCSSEFQFTDSFFEGIWVSFFGGSGV